MNYPFIYIVMEKLRIEPATPGLHDIGLSPIPRRLLMGPLHCLDIAERITTLANKHEPNRLINARKNDNAWLTTHVKKLIRKKKRLYDKYKKSNNTNHFETYKQFKI